MARRYKLGQICVNLRIFSTKRRKYVRFAPINASNSASTIHPNNAKLTDIPMLSDSNNASIMPRNILQMRSATSQGVLRRRKRAGRGAKYVGETGGTQGQKCVFRAKMALILRIFLKFPPNCPCSFRFSLGYRASE